MSWKKGLITALSKIAELKLTLIRPNHVTIVIYHRILPAQTDFKYDDGVISATPETFEEEVKFFKKYFTVTTFSQLKEILDNKKKFQSPLIITFDDGYWDNYTYAFPILKKYGVPATIFLAVSYIDSQKPYWWDEVAFLMRAMHKDPEQIKQSLNELKDMPNSIRKVHVQELSHKIKVNRAAMERMTMTWDEIQDMSRHGIEFGGHTMTHPALAQVEDLKDLQHEISHCKKIIEEKLNKKVMVFSYPFGGANAFNHLVKAKVQEAGYDFAVTYIQGINDFSQGSIDRYELKRLNMDNETLERVKIKLTWPDILEKR